MPVDVDGHLNRTVPHPALHIVNMGPLASSPEAIYQSLRRRRERLEKRQRDMELLQRGAVAAALAESTPTLDPDDVEDLEDAPENEVQAAEEEILDQATAARTIEELKAEIATLWRLENLALSVRRSGTDTKWRELSALLVFGENKGKFVVFTEHRDTLNYLQNKISTLLGRSESLVIIHGGLGREERRKAQESFLHDPVVQVLLATDAAGEGINLQRAHLMVNYDLPWNPNRIEQRFGRIHRIGQTEVCRLWNPVAQETRESLSWPPTTGPTSCLRTAISSAQSIPSILKSRLDITLPQIADCCAQRLPFSQISRHKSSARQSG